MKNSQLSEKLLVKLVLPVLVCCFVFLVVGKGVAQTPNVKAINNLMLLPVLVDDDQLTSPPLLSIFMSPSPSRRLVGPQVVVAIWQDGTVVRSQDEIRGGAPYLTGKLRPDQVEKVLSGACRIASRPSSSDRSKYLGPDSSWTTIAVRSDECLVYWKSWHELMESSGKLVAVDGSIRGLKSGETVEQVRKDECSKEYQNFIRRWDEIKTLMLESAPIDTLDVANQDLQFSKERFFGLGE
jgi:hypothetical protein